MNITKFFSCCKKRVHFYRRNTKKTNENIAFLLEVF